MGRATSLVRPRTVTGDGEGLVSHAGLAWLGEAPARYDKTRHPFGQRVILRP
jgi:hypothetical protein